LFVDLAHGFSLQSYVADSQLAAGNNVTLLASLTSA
jgi:hypothetical protein